VPNLIIPFPFQFLPTTEISVIFLHISVGNENASGSTLELIMKMELIKIDKTT